MPDIQTIPDRIAAALLTLQHGDDAAAVRALLPIVRHAATCVKRRHPQLDREELLQEALLRVIYAVRKGYYHYDPDRDAAPWLFVCARNGASEYARRSAIRNRLQALSLDAKRGSSSDDPCTLAEAVADPHAVDPSEDSRLHAAELVELLQGVRMTELERAALRRWAHGLTYAEIADELGVDRKAIDNSLSRARAKLDRFAEKQAKKELGR